ncbi:MAG: class IV adenylate cyclase, partial [Terriglobales bacterium]
YRTEYQRPGEGGVLAWDETPLGTFIEIEGAPAWVRRTARALALPIAAAEPRSYPEIYAASSAEGP